MFSGKNDKEDLKNVVEKSKIKEGCVEEETKTYQRLTINRVKKSSSRKVEQYNLVL